MSKIFETKERVTTPLGPGYILYVRLSAPTYTTACSYSVMLDDKLAASQQPPFPYYNGTIFDAAKVKEPIF